MNFRKSYEIEPELFEKYEVFRGLRKPNGAGVLVGLTRIGDVHGYVLENDKKIAIPGKLFYRGIDVAELVSACEKENRFGLEEVIYLLLFGKLPTAKELKDFVSQIYKEQKISAEYKKNVLKRSKINNVMNYLAQCVLAEYNINEKSERNDVYAVLSQCISLIAHFPLFVAGAYHGGNLTTKPKPNFSIAENFLYMLRGSENFTKNEAAILDTSLILHAEHGGGNNSSFTVHVVASTGTDTYSAIGAAICSLKGPKHGGANLAVLSMMSEIKANVKDWKNKDEVKAYLTKIIKKEAGDKSGLIYGIGHAIYTLSDPRAEILKEQAKLLAKEKGREDELNLYLLVEQLAPVVFKQVKNDNKVMCANVDFYTGFIYDMLGIPKELCTPIFAMSRIIGWCAHRLDELINGKKIIRPAFKDVGERIKYTPIKNRK